MSLINFQTLLIAIYTDENVRKKFTHDPESLFAATSLTDKEKHALQGLIGKPLELFSYSLGHKKRRVIEKMLTANPRLLIMTPDDMHASGPIMFFLIPSSPMVCRQQINQNQFEIIAHIKEGITPMNLMRYCLKAEDFQLSAVLHLARMAHSHNLWGKRVKIL